MLLLSRRIVALVITACNNWNNTRMGRGRKSCGINNQQRDHIEKKKRARAKTKKHNLFLEVIHSYFVFYSLHKPEMKTLKFV
mmetsp:Transcript_12416/g.14283  ORF Transcript_12416/g.14283 Transcript_12416/m.14283 type:complete len:82 (-) Transcript_12416:657-902(-)